ncbi:MAG: cephalosporin hydroxylase [Pseudonocardiales bacterium]|nr:MAG: cephalosporin hydroxylase [Pseudonocardiales bacterium]
MSVDPEVRSLDLALTTASDRHDFSYMWRWLGVPIIQMPTDMVLLQEIVWENRPQVIVETGIARGGSVLFYSSMLRLIGEGKIVAVDIDIRDHNRRAIEEHPLSDRVVLIEGSSTDSDVLDEVCREIGDAQRVMVVLDSHHSHEHVLAELRLYSPLVTSGQFIIVADTLLEELPVQQHRPRPWGPGDNPKTALDAFLAGVPELFELDKFSNDRLLLSSSRGGYLRRR